MIFPVFFLFIILHAQPLLAETITVDAEKMELFNLKKEAEFYGNVIVKREKMLLKSDYMRLLYKERNGENKLKSGYLKGDVYIETVEHKGWADEATFTAETELLILKGRAKVESSQGMLQGEVIQYNTRTRETKVLKGEVNEQVKFTFGDEGE